MSMVLVQAIKGLPDYSPQKITIRYKLLGLQNFSAGFAPASHTDFVKASFTFNLFVILFLSLSISLYTLLFLSLSVFFLSLRPPLLGGDLA